ncbi:MAG: hypothetical protein K0R25_965 [Rickettsiaceae bacterium]|jgi:hypothetical protein|nr:hypothetical protein [Rickettsiaceae bacterium]
MPSNNKKSFGIFALFVMAAKVFGQNIETLPNQALLDNNDQGSEPNNVAKSLAKAVEAFRQEELATTAAVSIDGERCVIEKNGDSVAIEFEGSKIQVDSDSFKEIVGKNITGAFCGQSDDGSFSVMLKESDNGNETDHLYNFVLTENSAGYYVADILHYSSSRAALVKSPAMRSLTQVTFSPTVVPTMIPTWPPVTPAPSPNKDDKTIRIEFDPASAIGVGVVVGTALFCCCLGICYKALRDRQEGRRMDASAMAAQVAIAAEAERGREALQNAQSATDALRQVNDLNMKDAAESAGTAAAEAVNTFGRKVGVEGVALGALRDAVSKAASTAALLAGEHSANHVKILSLAAADIVFKKAIQPQVGRKREVGEEDGLLKERKDSQVEEGQDFSDFSPGRSPSQASAIPVDNGQKRDGKAVLEV